MTRRSAWNPHSISRRPPRHSRARADSPDARRLAIPPNTHHAPPRLHGRGMLTRQRRVVWEMLGAKMFTSGVGSPAWAPGASIGASATAGFPTRTGRASRGLSRLGRAVTWRRDTSFARRALSSFDGHGRNAASRDSVGGRNIANHALSVPPQEVTEEDADSEDYDPGGGPNILRFNGDTLMLHQSLMNGSTSRARRAAAQGTVVTYRDVIGGTNRGSTWKRTLLETRNLTSN